MAQNRGKQFEEVVRECFERVPGVSIDRLHDQTTGFKGSQNICDFIVYKKPYEYYFECKTIHGNTLSIHSNDPKHKYGNITNRQWEGLLEKSKIKGVKAGVICWWVDRDTTVFMPIEFLVQQRNDFKRKSVQYGYASCYFESAPRTVTLKGKKKRVFFDYDMEDFLRRLNNEV